VAAQAVLGKVTYFDRKEVDKLLGWNISQVTTAFCKNLPNSSFITILSFDAAAFNEAHLKKN
jgi:hypothetical protein